MINVAIVMFSQIAVKLLGMIYRVVITNIPGFGDLGNGYLKVNYSLLISLLIALPCMVGYIILLWLKKQKVIKSSITVIF